MTSSDRRAGRRLLAFAFAFAFALASVAVGGACARPRAEPAAAEATARLEGELAALRARVWLLERAQGSAAVRCAAPAAPSRPIETTAVGETAPAAYFAALESEHAADSSDGAGAERSADTLRVFATAEAPAFALDSVECRRRTCRVALHAPPASESAPPPDLEAFIARAGALFAEASVDTRPTGEVVVYLSGARL